MNPADDLMEQHPNESELLDFTAGALSAEAAASVTGHLDTCSRCQQTVLRLKRTTKDALQPLGADEIGNDPTRVGFDLLIGSMVGEYRILERINQGGMGVLYRGEQPVIGKPVAIKVLLPEIAADPTLVNRLLGEARAVNSIRHANIIDIFSLGQLPDGRHYMVMELLEGQSLADLLKERGRLQATEVQLVLEQSMAALEAAHAAGVIHRDLKPENIFVNPRADGWRITVLDFGLAKQQGSFGQLTAPNMVLGTPGYMAPEQIRGQDVTTAIDVYAMGIVAWALLAGREPYSGGSIVEVMKRHLEAPVPAVRAHVPGVPVGLEALVASMMAKDPADRPTAAAVRKILSRLKGDPRRYDGSVELTQLTAPITARDGVAPVERTVDITPSNGSEPVEPLRPDPSLLSTSPDREVRSTVINQPVLVVEPAPVKDTDPALVTVGPPALSIEMRALLDTFNSRRTPLLIVGVGLALFGVAVGLIFFHPTQALPLPPPPPPIEKPVVVKVEPPAKIIPPVVEVDPPRPRPSRAEVERSLAGARAKVPGLSRAARRRAVLQLGKLEARLKKNAEPAAVARDLDKLIRDYGLK